MDCLDLTQDEDNDGNMDSDALFDLVLPEVPRLDSGISSGSGSWSGVDLLRGKRKSVDSQELVVKKKKQTSIDRQTKKQKLLEEKAAKQANNELNKIYKPGECMKYMNIELHPTLQSVWYMSDVARELGETGASITSQPDMFDHRVLCWTRTCPQRFAAKDGVVQLTSPKESCDRCLYIMTADDVAPLVSEHRLSQHMTEVAALTSCDVTLAVFGVKEYFKKSNRKTKNSGNKLMNEIELEMALTDLLVTANCDCLLVNTPNELALHILYLTKAIAEAPFKKAKRACDEQVDFYMRGDNKKSVAVDSKGHGCSRLWQQMLAILPHSSLETSRSIYMQYKSPLDLYEALQLPNGEQELADVGVARAAVPGSKARRLGPEFARKLKILFTSENGEELVD